MAVAWSDDRRTCAGCLEKMRKGDEVSVTVTSGQHVMSVYAHAGHTEMARANVMQDPTWKRDKLYGPS